MSARHPHAGNVQEDGRPIAREHVDRSGRVQRVVKYVAGRRELIARTLFVHLDRNEKGEMDVTGIAVNASRNSNGNSAFYRTDDFDMNPVTQEAVDRVREMVNQDCAKLVD